MEAALLAVYVTALIASFFFWGRGLVRSSKGDLVAGIILFALICGISFVAAGSSAVFGLIGMLMILFGVFNLVLSTLAKPDSLLKKATLRMVGVVAIILRLCLSVII